MKNLFWIDFSKYEPLKEGKYLVLYYDDIDIAYWSGKWFETKWVLDEDDSPIDIVYNKSTVTHWMELPDKPTIIAEPAQIAQKNEFVIPAVSVSVCPHCQSDSSKIVESEKRKCFGCGRLFYGHTER